MRNINRLNEEIARWAFEIIYKTNTLWRIAFTNPTAGPWKTIKSPSKITGQEGEVYRFILEEDRPDIIMYNDELETVIIIEAKDSLEKLLEREQARKSAAVVVKLANILGSKGSNTFWRGRENYKVVLGLLWGSTDYPESQAEKNRLYNHYHNLVKDEDVVFSSIIVGVETLYSSGELHCTAFYKSYNESSSSLGNQIIKTLM
jgi:hypothetical protein